MAEALRPVSIVARHETPTTTSFVFELEEALDYEAGQYVAVNLAEVDDPSGPQRPFTLASSPSEGRRVCIATKMTASPFKRQLASLGSEQLDDGLKMRGPMGEFTLDTERAAVMITGGIGITPFRSMLRCALDQGLELPIVLLYSNTTPSEIAFHKELDEIARDSDRLEVVHTVTRPQQADAWDGRTGRIDAELIRTHAQALDQPLYYVCGPPSMVESITELLLQTLQVPDADVRAERFTGYD